MWKVVLQKGMVFWKNWVSNWTGKEEFWVKWIKLLEKVYLLHQHMIPEVITISLPDLMVIYLALVFLKTVLKLSQILNLTIRVKAQKMNNYVTSVKNIYDRESEKSSSSLATRFLPEYADQSCNRLRIIIQEKQCGNGSNNFGDELFVIFDNLLEYQCVIKTLHKNFFINFRTN